MKKNSVDQEALKKRVAEAALDYIESGMVIGVGSGSTVNYFIDALKSVRGKIDGAVASSEATAARLSALSIPLIDLNSVNEVPLYVDGADEINPYKQMIKGGGGALTREKIIATVATTFVCITDQTKQVDLLGAFPVAIEVIPMARSFVAREVVKLNGHPVYRQGVVTDNGNVILDVYFSKIVDPVALEASLNQLEGVVANGIFGKRGADILLLGTTSGVIKK